MSSIILSHNHIMELWHEQMAHLAYMFNLQALWQTYNWNSTVGWICGMSRCSLQHLQTRRHSDWLLQCLKTSRCFAFHHKYSFGSIECWCKQGRLRSHATNWLKAFAVCLCYMIQRLGNSLGWALARDLAVLDLILAESGNLFMGFHAVLSPSHWLKCSWKGS